MEAPSSIELVCDPFSRPPLSENDILLRPLEFADVPAWYEYLSMPTVVENTSWNVRSPDELSALVERCHSSGPGSLIRFAAIDSSHARMIGSVGFHTISRENRTAEMAFDFHPEFWGRGIATECCRSTLEWGFERHQFVRIQATALDTNHASLRVLEKCGFALEGRLRNFRLVRGIARDFWMYSSVPLA